MISLKAITKKHGSKTVFVPTTATIERGDCIMVVGPNGAGKTTLFNILVGKTKPDTGSVLLDGQNITMHDDRTRAAWIRVLAQNPADNVVTSMTVAENLALALSVQLPISCAPGLQPVTTKLVGQITKEYGIDLTPLLQTPMQQLSGGQRQLIAFIMLTLTKPKLLLLDEPTAALDPHTATMLLACVYRFIQEHQITALIITHDPAMAANLGNKLWHVDNQTITVYDAQQKNDLTPEELVGSISYAKIIGHSTGTGKNA